MASAKQLLTRFQRQLGQFQQKQQIYRYKLEQLNKGRTHLANQIDMLHLDYNKKIKQMESKIKSLATENESLVRQNQIYKGQIETFNSRLLQKEKLISSLVSQQREKSQKPCLQNSRSSRNQEQRSETASQGNQNKQARQRLFKKNAASKVKNYRQQQSSSVDTYNLNLNSPNRYVPSQYIPQNIMSTDLPIDMGIQKPQSVPVFNYVSPSNEVKNKVIPPPGPKRTVAKIDNQRNGETYQSQAHKKASNLPRPPIPVKKTDQKLARYPIDSNQQNHASNDFLSHFHKEEQNHYQTVTKQTQEYNNDGNNIMSYFNPPQEKINQKVHQDQTHQDKNQTQQSLKKVFPPKVAKRRNEERIQLTQNSFQQYQTPSGLDFFNKLGKGEAPDKKVDTAGFFSKTNEHNGQEPPSQAFMDSDIQQSSIDYQQNSLMSSTANMFTDISDLTAPSKETGRVVKKKARRDKIKMVDPKSFE